MQESQEFTGRLFLTKLNRCRMISPVVQESPRFCRFQAVDLLDEDASSASAEAAALDSASAAGVSSAALSSDRCASASALGASTSTTSAFTPASAEAVSEQWVPRLRGVQVAIRERHRAGPQPTLCGRNRRCNRAGVRGQVRGDAVCGVHAQGLDVLALLARVWPVLALGDECLVASESR